MKIHCHRPSLLTAFQVAGGVVPVRTPREILTNVKLQVTGAAATLIGTDSEVGIRYEISGVEVETPGEILLPTSRVVSILRELTDDGVNLEVTDSAVMISSGHSRFRLSVEDPAEFPPVSGFEDDSGVAVAGGVLREAIQRTVFATDVESTRYALGGVLLELKDDTLTLAATDSRRLAVARAACRAAGAEFQNEKPVVPSKAMSLIEKSIAEDDQEVFIAVHANDVLIKTGPATVSSRLVDGRFPRYQDVIPANAGQTLDLSVGPFYSAVRQAQIVTNQDSRGVDFQFGKGLLTLNSRATDVGESNVELPIDYEGEDLTITFDPRFVAEFLRVLGPETRIQLSLIDPESAAVFRTDDAYTYVVMPLSRDR